MTTLNMELIDPTPWLIEDAARESLNLLLRITQYL
jgi:hypothetical protein